MDKIIIVKYNNYFTVKPTHSYKEVIVNFASKYETFNTLFIRNKKRIVPDKKFYVIKDGVYRFNSNTFIDFVKLLKNNLVKKESIDYREVGIKKRDNELNLVFNKDYVLRDYQEEYVKEILARNISLIELKTGSGKTVIGMNAAVKLNDNLCILTKNTYLIKWIDDIKNLTNVNKGEFIVVNGTDKLEKILKNGKSYKIVLLSVDTLIAYAKKTKISNLPESPNTIAERLNFSTLLIDEVHDRFHLYYLSLLYLKVNNVIAMSATLISNSSKVNMLYNIMFDRESRISNFVKATNYLNVVNIGYSLIRKVRSEGNYGYSHNEYEDNIVKNRETLVNYLKILDDCVIKYYLERRKDGQKCLIFASTIKMCNIVNSFLNSKYGDLFINTYVGGDDYNNLMTSDISVSNYASAGTGKDINGLITAINTVPTHNKQRHIQSPGRLRYIEGIELYYINLYNLDDNKQVKMTDEFTQTITPSTKTLEFKKNN